MSLENNVDPDQLASLDLQFLIVYVWFHTILKEFICILFKHSEGFS